VSESCPTKYPTIKKETLFPRKAGPRNGIGLFMAHEVPDITRIAIWETGVFGNGAQVEMAIPQEGYRFPDEDPNTGNYREHPG
jgi:hypothetical protein